jgi:hypothetical protein
MVSAVLFRHLATGVCAKDTCRAPFIPVVEGQRFHPLCDPDAHKTLTGSRWRACLAAVPVPRLDPANRAAQTAQTDTTTGGTE